MRGNLGPERSKGLEVKSNVNREVDRSLYGGLQIRPHETYGYRNQITVYEVMEDVTAPMGQALANRAYGPGGYTQYYIEGFQSKLRPITTLQLSR